MCTRTETYVFAFSTLQTFAAATGKVWIGRNINNQTTFPNLTFGVQITRQVYNQDAPGTYVEYTIRQPALWVLQAGPVIEVLRFYPRNNITETPETAPVTRTYAATESYEYWCDVEEILNVTNSQTENYYLGRLRPRLGGTYGASIGGRTAAVTITAGNRATAATYAVADVEGFFTVYTSTQRAATTDGATPVSRLTNFGVPGVSGSGGTVTGSMTMQWDCGDTTIDALPAYGSLTFHHHKSDTLPSGGTNVTVVQDYDTTLDVAGHSLTISATPMPPNLSPNDTASSQNPSYGQLGDNRAGGTINYRVQAYKIFDVTAKLVGPSGQIVPLPLYIKASGSFPALDGVGSVQYQRREGGSGNSNSYKHNGNVVSALDGIFGPSAFLFPEDNTGTIQRTLAPLIDEAIAVSYDTSKPFYLLGHSWDRRKLIASLGPRYIFGGAGKPSPPLNSGAFTAGWNASQGVTLSLVSGALRAVVGATPTGTPQVQLSGGGGNFGQPSAAFELEYRYVRLRLRSVGSANKAVTVVFGGGQPSFGTNPGTIDRFVTSTGADGEWVERTFDRLSPYATIAGNRGRTYVDTEGSVIPSDTKDAPLIEYDSGQLILTSLSASTTYEFAWFRLEAQDGFAVESTYAQQYGAADGKRSPVPVIGQTYTYPAWMDNRAWSATILDQARSDKLDYGSTADSPITDLYDSEYQLTAQANTFWNPLAPQSVPGAGVTFGVREGFATRRMLPKNDGSGQLYETFQQQYFFDAYALGDVFRVAGGAFGIHTPLEYVYFVASQLRGTIINGNATTRVAETATNAAAGDGAPTVGGYFATGAPYLQSAAAGAYKAFLVGKDGKFSGALWGNRRYWFYSESPSNQPLCIDSARGWLHLGKGKQIITYHEALLAPGVTPTPVWTPTEHPVQEWLALCYDERQVSLFGAARLAPETGETRGKVRVYRSRNGGRTITEILTMTVRTMAMERDSERGILLLIYEAEGYLSRKISRDGGATWETTTTPLFDGVSVPSGEVLDLAQDTRQAGTMWLSAKVGDQTKLYRSRDLGQKWTSVLS